MSGRRGERAELARWGACGAVVVFAHLGAAMLVAGWANPIAPAELAGGITVELAPVATAPAPALDDVAPGLKMTRIAPPTDARPDDRLDDKPADADAPRQADAPPESAPPDEAQAAPVPPPENAEVPLPLRPVEHRAPARRARAPARAATAPPRASQVAALAAAPSQGQPAAFVGEIAGWKGQIVAAIERNKSYPPEADAKGEQGAPAVSFSIDRQGRLLSSRLVRGSGVASLDQEALAILKRAQPFPPPPASVTGARFNFTVPIRFHQK